MKNTSGYQELYHPSHQDQREQEAVGDCRKNHRKESLFEKLLTPSDVGKLNRLVIPKHHAERHFPVDPNSAEKGRFLNFEDEAGKMWRFRYLYWSSSQSHVFTKGWSRFVKEKRLDAGDIVLFERGRRDGHRLYIGWKRCGEVTPAPAVGDGNRMSYDESEKPVGLGSCSQGYDCHFTSPDDGSSRQEEGENEKLPKVTTENPKRLRLFGVNLEYDVDPSK